MRLRLTASVLSVTAAFVALPTVQLPAHADSPVPVAPKVVNSPVVDADASRQSPPLRTTTAPSPLTPRKREVLTELLNRPAFTVAGVSWAQTAGVTSRELRVSVRLLERGRWSGWEQLSVPDDGPDAASAEGATARVGTAPIVTSGATGIQVRATSTTAVPTDLRVTTIDPGTSKADDDLTATTPPGSASAAAVKPTIITRKSWGADERLRRPATLNATVKAITIHHTAGTNSYTADTAAAQVRGIYAYDTQGLGWTDIAYNFLVDKYGRIYEGRAGSITSAVRGAHAMGFNVDTMGVAAMGNYETVAAPAVMVDAMAKVAGWKLSQYGRDPLGKVTLVSQGGSGAKFAAGRSAVLDVVNAHQNTSYTLCPGKYLFPLMGTIRSKAATYARYSSTTVPKPAAPKPAATLYALYGSTTVKAGSKGAAVKALQTELNRRKFPVGTADGSFGAKTTAGVRAFQKAALITQTGVVAANEWKALSNLAYTKTAAPKPPTPQTPPTPAKPKVISGFDADGRPDVIGRTADGGLYWYRGTAGAFAAGARVGTGWGSFAQVFSPGDINGDGRADVVATTASGQAWLYPGRGNGYVSSRVSLGTGWAPYPYLAGPGDVTGDGLADLYARKPNGELWLFAGTGSSKGTLAKPRRVATGLHVYVELITPGDMTGDGKADLLGRKANGELFLMAGLGNGTFAPAKRIGTGWQMFNTVISAGDVTGDGRADVIGRTPSGRSYIYAGTGWGTLRAGKVFTAPWGNTTRIAGVR